MDERRFTRREILAGAVGLAAGGLILPGAAKGDLAITIRGEPSAKPAPLSYAPWALIWTSHTGTLRGFHVVLNREPIVGHADDYEAIYLMIEKHLPAAPEGFRNGPAKYQVEGRWLRVYCMLERA